MRQHVHTQQPYICVNIYPTVYAYICVDIYPTVYAYICVDIYPTVYAYICVHIYPTKQAYMRQHISYCICVELILVYNGCLFSRLLCGERGRRYLPVNYSWKKRDKKVGKWNAGTFLKLLKQMLSLWYNFFFWKLSGVFVKQDSSEIGLGRERRLIWCSIFDAINGYFRRFRVNPGVNWWVSVWFSPVSLRQNLNSYYQIY